MAKIVFTSFREASLFAKNFTIAFKNPIAVHRDGDTWWVEDQAIVPSTSVTGFGCDGLNIFTGTRLTSEGYDAEGFDINGFNTKGVHKLTGTEVCPNGFDKNGNGIDADGYNKKGFDINGFDRDGFDKEGYDNEGYDRDGYSKGGSDVSVLPFSGVTVSHRKSLNRDGYDRDGYNERGFDKNQLNRAGIHIDAVLEMRNKELKARQIQDEKQTRSDGGCNACGLINCICWR